MRGIHFKPQTNFILSNVRGVQLDFVGFLENFDADFSYVTKKLNREKVLLRLNKSDHRDYKDHFTPDLIEIVGDVYSEDIAFLGYTFDNSNLPSQIENRDSLLDDLI